MRFTDWTSAETLRAVERYVRERALADARDGQSGDREGQPCHTGPVPRVAVLLSGYAEVTAQACAAPPGPFSGLNGMEPVSCEQP
jgi:hypothetical protein